MNVLASSYEPFARDLRSVSVYSEWMVERVPADKQLAGQLERWRTMNLRGWDVTALLAPDSKTVVAVGCRVRPNDKHSGLQVLPGILHGVKVKVPEGLFGAASVRLLEALGVSVRVKPRTKGPS